MGAPTIVINGVITTVNGFKYRGNRGYHRYKRSYGTLLISGRGPLCGNEFLFWAGFYQKFASQVIFLTDFTKKNIKTHIGIMSM